MEERKEYRFEFSVVMAVYNVEPFLREAVESLVAQDFGFEKIQLIMVDDGSTDGSGAICDEYAAKYPNNVMVIHKENGGVASARNAGLCYAEGRYLNFMDSDDGFTPNSFRLVYDFFRKNESETDVVTIPLEFFDAQTGPHWQNGKFLTGTRLINLLAEHQTTLMFVNASFFANHLRDQISFDGHLVCGEDIKMILSVLVHKMTIGVVADCKYMYRRRSVGEASLIQSAKKKYGWYFDYFAYLVDWTVDFYKNQFGFLPGFVQYELMCDIQWRFGQNYDMKAVLTPEEIEQYKARLFGVLHYFEDKYILEQKMIGNIHKLFILSQKYSPIIPCLSPLGELIFGETRIPLAPQFVWLEFMKLEERQCAVEGHISLPPLMANGIASVSLVANGTEYPCEKVERYDVALSLGEPAQMKWGFRSTVPLTGGVENTVYLRIRTADCSVDIKNLSAGEFFPLSSRYKNSYYCQGSWKAILLEDKGLMIAPRRFLEGWRSEPAFLWEVWKRNELGGRKAVLARLAYHFLRLWKRKPIWLLSDRVMKADDNGEALFRYLQKEHRGEAKFYYVLSKDSVDYQRIKRIGPVVNGASGWFKLMYLLCDYCVSASGDNDRAAPFYGYSDSYRDILRQIRYVFLQHGIIKDDLSGWLSKYRKNIAGFVTAAAPEYDSILSGKYGYSEKEVWLTGLPRFDRLYHQEEKIITIMPTWRQYLMGNIKGATGLRDVGKEFLTTEYYAFYNGLVNHPKLLSATQSLGYQLQCFPHPNLQPHLSLFHQDPRVRFLDFSSHYRDVYAESALVVSDYSSAVFDFAYLRKPIVYCQFDKEEFFAGQHVYTKGYFDYERDGFGEVEYDLEGTVDRIIEYMKNGCQLKDKYRERIDKFFAFHDRKNCQRVYEKIKELSEG